MRNKSFGEFMDKKKRESIHQLKILKKLLESNGLKVESFLDNNDSKDLYIFCQNTSKDGGFDGVRIYKIGGEFAFRVQKESKTHPYGAAYSLPIESMYSDLLTDEGINEMKAGKKIIEAVGKEIKKFFEKSFEAERSTAGSERKVVMKDSDSDMAAMSFTKV